MRSVQPYELVVEALALSERELQERVGILESDLRACRQDCAAYRDVACAALDAARTATLEGARLRERIRVLVAELWRVRRGSIENAAVREGRAA
jgi:hypothetical protein